MDARDAGSGGFVPGDAAGFADAVVPLIEPAAASLAIIEPPIGDHVVHHPALHRASKRSLAGGDIAGTVLDALVWFVSHDAPPIEFL